MISAKHVLYTCHCPLSVLQRLISQYPESGYDCIDIAAFISSTERVIIPRALKAQPRPRVKVDHIAHVDVPRVMATCGLSTLKLLFLVNTDLFWKSYCWKSLGDEF